MRTVVPAMAAHLYCSVVNRCLPFFCILQFFASMDLPGKTELGMERDETVCEPAGDTEDAVVVPDEFEV